MAGWGDNSAFAAPGSYVGGYGGYPAGNAYGSAYGAPVVGGGSFVGPAVPMGGEAVIGGAERDVGFEVRSIRIPTRRAVRTVYVDGPEITQHVRGPVQEVVRRVRVQGPEQIRRVPVQGPPREVVRKVAVQGPPREVVRRVEVRGEAREVVKRVEVQGPPREIIKRVEVQGPPRTVVKRVAVQGPAQERVEKVQVPRPGPPREVDQPVPVVRDVVRDVVRTVDMPHPAIQEVVVPVPRHLVVAERPRMRRVRVPRVEMVPRYVDDEAMVPVPGEPEFIGQFPGAPMGGFSMGIRDAGYGSYGGY